MNHFILVHLKNFILVHFFPLEGVCFSSAGNANKYIAIHTPMTWHDAQEYCRKRQADLATVTDKEDLSELRNVSEGLTPWIGLHDDPEARRTVYEYPNSWLWSSSMLSRTDYVNFEFGQPDYKGGNEECMTMGLLGTWFDEKCSSENEFVCFDGKRRFVIHVIATYIQPLIRI